MYLAQCSINDNFTYETIITTGFLVKDGDGQVVIAGDILGEDVRRVLVIPKENIISINNLKYYEISENEIELK